MNSPLLASLIDHSLLIISGIICTLIGFRLLGPKPEANEKFDTLHSKWLKHFKWLGPLSIAIAVLQMAISGFASTPKESSAYSSENMRQTVNENLSAEGRLSDRDHLLRSSDGFALLIPKGYTYSKPPNYGLSLVAGKDFNGVKSPIITVAVMPLEGSIEQLIESIKKAAIEKHNAKFSEAQINERGNYGTIVLA